MQISEQKTKKESGSMKTIIIAIVILMYALLIAAIGYVLTRNDPIRPRPVEEPGPSPVINKCTEKAKVEMTCSAVGYEFDPDGGKCITVNGAGCIDKLPFGTLKECQDACEEPVDSISTTVGDDFLITLDADMSAGYSWEADFDEHYLMLRSKDFAYDGNGPKLGSTGREVFTFTPIQSGETSVTMGYGRPFESRPYEVKVFNYRISDNKDAALATNKAEYEKREIVKITMYNISNNVIWFMEGVSKCNTRPYRIYKLSGGEWKEVSGYPTICVGAASEQVPFYTKLLPGVPANLEWDQKLWDYPRQTYDADGGIYRIVMKYGRSEDGSGERSLYSNEFTINEKSAIGPKCGQIVSGYGMCEAFWEGIEFDQNSGNCVKRGVSGCSFETPFETMEECQKACKRGDEEKIIFETDKTTYAKGEIVEALLSFTKNVFVNPEVRIYKEKNNDWEFLGNWTFDGNQITCCGLSSGCEINKAANLPLKIRWDQQIAKEPLPILPKEPQTKIQVDPGKYKLRVIYGDDSVCINGVDAEFTVK